MPPHARSAAFLASDMVALRLLQRRFGLREGAFHVSTLGAQRRQLSPILVELGPPLPPLSLAFLPKVRKPVRAEGRAAQGAVGLPLSQHPVAATQLHEARPPAAGCRHPAARQPRTVASSSAL